MIEATLSLLDPLIYQLQICLLKRIPAIYKTMLEAFDFESLFKILDSENKENYLKHNLKHVVRLTKIENNLIKRGGRNTFNIEEIKQQCKKARSLLIPIYENQKIWVM